MKKVFQNYRQIIAVMFTLGFIFLAFSGYLTTIFGFLMDPIVGVQTIVSERFSTAMNFFTIPRDVTELQAENRSLKEEVALLRTGIIQLEQDLREAEILYSLLGFARGRPTETYIAASVIGKDPSPFLQYVLIDRGSDDGVTFGMPVVTEKGLVGRIDAVTASAARVQLITDPASMVNAYIVEADTDGVVRGSVTSDLTVEMISQDVTLEFGQTIQTSGLGGRYPSEIMIGQILNVNRMENELFQSASIQPAEDFSSLQAVLVVANFRPSNISPLEPSGD